MMMRLWVAALAVLAPSEQGEVNTAAILAWTVLAVVAIAGINILFDDLVTTVFNDVKDRILGIGG